MLGSRGVMRGRWWRVQKEIARLELLNWYSKVKRNIVFSVAYEKNSVLENGGVGLSNFVISPNAKAPAFKTAGALFILLCHRET